MTADKKATAGTTTAPMLKMFDAARGAGVPLLSIRTADQAETLQALLDYIETRPEKTPVVRWDAAMGMVAANKAGDAALKATGIKPADTFGFTEAMIAALALPEPTVVVALNAMRQLHSQEPKDAAAAVQAVSNLRDPFKKNFRTLVLLGADVKAPAELEHDIISITHALPGPKELAQIAAELYEAAIHDNPQAGLKPPTQEHLGEVAAATVGLSGFEAEQQVAMSFGESGLDMPMLWERKRVAIEQTPGLSVYRGRETFDDLRGLANVKARMRQLARSRTPVGCVAWIDEGADVFSAVESGQDDQKMDAQRLLLTEMELNDWRGVIFVGVPGSGKSQIGRAFGNEAGVLTISVDFGAMENKFVGESEARRREAIDRIKSVGGGNAFWILTCNSLKGIRPQFQRRFRRGVFFFDLPSAPERAAIWALYMKKYELPKQQMPDDEGWTGAEIRECCMSAWDTSTTLLEAAKYIIPVARSRAREIEEMRKEAHGRFLDASHEGAYTYEQEPMRKQVRAISLPRAVASMEESQS